MPAGKRELPDGHILGDPFASIVRLEEKQQVLAALISRASRNDVADVADCAAELRHGDHVAAAHRSFDRLFDAQLRYRLDPPARRVARVSVARGGNHDRPRGAHKDFVGRDEERRAERS